MSKKYYAVLIGKQTGIFNSWDEIKPLVIGYSGSKYKSFKTLSEAKMYLSSVPFVPPISIPPVSVPPISVSPVSVPPISVSKNNLKQEIVVYTDGSCVDKIGGYGYVVLDNMNQEETERKGKVPFYPTTNQVAELYAIYVLFQVDLYEPTLLVKNIIVRTDSAYSIGCLTKWYKNWERNGWVNSKNQPVKNSLLIKQILSLIKSLEEKEYTISFEHVKAHQGNHYNEIADRLANEGRYV